jgi:hypothetical protein
MTEQERNYQRLWADERVARALRGEPGEWTPECAHPGELLDFHEQGARHPRAAALRAHIASCAFCRRGFGEIHAARQLAAGLRAQETGTSGAGVPAAGNAARPGYRPHWPSGRVPASRRWTQAALVTGLLVALLVGAVSASILLPLLESWRNDSLLKACKANMIALFQAEEAYRVRNRRYADGSDPAEMEKMFQGMGGAPRCPTNDAIYVIYAVDEGKRVIIRCNGTHTINPVYDGESFTRKGVP